MLNVEFYRAERDYRREQLRRDFRPLWARRAAKAAARNQIVSDGRSDRGA